MIPLTPRETQLLGVVRDGASNKQAAFLLGCSEQTVKNHMNHIFKTLDVQTRTAAVMRAIEEGRIGVTPEVRYPTSIGVCLDALRDLERRLGTMMTLVAAVRSEVLLIAGDLAEDDAFEAGTAVAGAISVRNAAVTAPLVSNA